MILDLSDDAQEYGRQARHAFESAGGDHLVAQAEAAPEIRESLVGPVLAELGAWELDPRTDTDGAGSRRGAVPQRGLLGAALPARRTPGQAGRPRRRRSDRHRRRPARRHRRRARVTMGGSHSGRTPQPGRRGWPDGAGIRHRTGAVTDRRRRRGGRGTGTGPAVLDAARHARPGAGADRRARESAQAVRPAAVVVPGGAVPADRRRGRAQRRGHPRQARVVEHRHRSAPEATDDALALRMAAIEAADVVFRVCHQLHGAVGFCDETQLSWLSRYSQPLRRLPFGLSATRDHLTRIAGRRGLAGLYS